MVKKILSIDPNVKGAILESFDKSHLSESFDVPAGCIVTTEITEPRSELWLMSRDEDKRHGV